MDIRHRGHCGQDGHFLASRLHCSGGRSPIPDDATTIGSREPEAPGQGRASGERRTGEHLRHTRCHGRGDGISTRVDFSFQRAPRTLTVGKGPDVIYFRGPRQGSGMRKTDRIPTFW